MNTLLREQTVFSKLELVYYPPEPSTMDETVINAELSLFDFGYGYCYLFAAALNKLFGHKMNVIWNENRLGGGGVVHAYAHTKFYGDEYFFDAHGQTSLQDINYYIEEEIDSEEQQPLFTYSSYDDYRYFFKDFAVYAAVTEEYALKMEQQIDDVIAYLKLHMRMYTPNYTSTARMIESFGLPSDSIQEEQTDSNECLFTFSLNNHTYKILLRRDHTYQIQKFLGSELKFGCAANNIGDLKSTLALLVI